ncbi:MAG: NUDIX hydrolase [Lachnospiraceae bacterium]|nr:NUDIX hydrolase [Lachnospiraceae bacterium]
MEEIKRLKRDLIHKGNVIDFYEDTMQIPNGNVVKWDFIEHQGAAAVVAVRDDGKLIMVRQYRNALERYTLELPAGCVDYKGEPTVEAAKRELTEETGFTADSFELLISIYTTVAFCNEKIDIYVAKGLKAGQQDLDEDEYINVEVHDIEELCRMIYDCEIQDSKTVAAVMAYKNKYC